MCRMNPDFKFDLHYQPIPRRSPMNSSTDDSHTSCKYCVSDATEKLECLAFDRQMEFPRVSLRTPIYIVISWLPTRNQRLVPIPVQCKCRRFTNPKLIRTWLLHTKKHRIGSVRSWTKENDWHCQRMFRRPMHTLRLRCTCVQCPRRVSAPTILWRAFKVRVATASINPPLPPISRSHCRHQPWTMLDWLFENVTQRWTAPLER